MAALTMQNSRQLIDLIEQLTSFGLNPDDWRIQVPIRSGHVSAIEVINRNDNEFRIHAAIDRKEDGRLSLSELHLASW